MTGQPSAAVNASGHVTIELELSTAEVRGLTAAVVANHCAENTVVADVAPWYKARHFRQSAGVAAAALLLIGAFFIAADPVRSTPRAASPDQSVLSTAPLQPASVKFPNPFDPEEVFEFPFGTSEVAAREAVSELLMQRARERQAAPEHRPKKNPAAPRH